MRKHQANLDGGSAYKITSIAATIITETFRKMAPAKRSPEIQLYVTRCSRWDSMLRKR